MSRSGSASPTHGQCGFMRCMRPCLKSPLPSPGFMTPQLRKNVSFNDSVLEDVHIADDWDRTPLEPCRKLSYQDILELKEIQRTLPRANQLDDPHTGKRAPHYLSSVPVGLLPLLPESSPKTPDSSTIASPAKPTNPIPPPQLKFNLNFMPLGPAPPPAPSIPTAQRAWHPPDLSHLTASKPPPARAKPSFAFLPLLDTAPSAEMDIPSDSEASTDPPTPSLTNASLESSPRSYVSSSLESSPECTPMPLPEAGFERRKDYSASYLHGDDCDSSSFDDRQSALFYTPPHRLGGRVGAWAAFPTHKREPSRSPERPAPAPAPAPPAAPAKKRNVMVLNGIEIDLDELEDAVSTPRTTSPRVGVLTTPTPTPVDSNTPCASPQPSPRPAPASLPPTKVPTAPTKPPSTPALATSPPKRCGSPLCSPLLFQPDTRTRSAAT